MTHDALAWCNRGGGTTFTTEKRREAIPFTAAVDLLVRKPFDDLLLANGDEPC